MYDKLFLKFMSDHNLYLTELIRFWEVWFNFNTSNQSSIGEN